MLGLPTFCRWDRRAAKFAGFRDARAQLYGTREVERLGRPLLLVHGLRDDILSAECSKDIYERAGEPKEVVLLEESDHLLEHDADKIFELVKHWVIENTRNLAHLN